MLNVKCSLILVFTSISYLVCGQVVKDSTHKDSVPAFNFPTSRENEWNTREWNLKASYSYQKYHVISIGLGRLGEPVFLGSCSTSPNGADGFALSMQAYLRPGYSPLYSLGLSWEASFFYFFKGMIEANYITNFNKGDLYIKPELGLKFAAVFYVVYGYSIPLTNNLTEIDLGKSSITIGISLPFSAFSD